LSDEKLTALSVRLDPIDWIVIGIYMLSMIVIGWWYSRRNRDGGDYVVGGRKMNPWTVGLSFFVALFSTISYLAIPGEIVRYGPIVFSGLLAYPLIYFLVGWFIIPPFMKLNVNSGYELLESRLGVGPRMLGVTLFLLLRLLWMAVIIYATVDKVLVPLTGLPESAYASPLPHLGWPDHRLHHDGRPQGHRDRGRHPSHPALWRCHRFADLDHIQARRRSRLVAGHLAGALA
jgi:hypothetical protein